MRYSVHYAGFGEEYQYTMFDALLAKQSEDSCRTDGGTPVPGSYVPGVGVKCSGGATSQAAEVVLGDIAKATAEAAQAYAAAVAATQSTVDAAKAAAAAKAAVDAKAVADAKATGLLPADTDVTTPSSNSTLLLLGAVAALYFFLK